MLNALACLITSGEVHLTLTIAHIFRPLIPEFIARVVRKRVSEKGADKDYLRSVEKISASFSVLLPLAPHIFGYVFSNLQHYIYLYLRYRLVLEFYRGNSSIYDRITSNNIKFASLKPEVRLMVWYTL